MTELFDDLSPSPRLLMGPGPVDAYPRVLRAMSVPMLADMLAIASEFGFFTAFPDSSTVLDRWTELT